MVGVDTLTWIFRMQIMDPFHLLRRTGKNGREGYFDRSTREVSRAISAEFEPRSISDSTDILT